MFWPNLIRVGGMAGKKKKKTDALITFIQLILGKMCRSNGRRGWFPSNYVEVLNEEMPPFPRPPDQPLPLNPQQQSYIMDMSRRVSSIHSSSSSEVSRNNANLPDGWTIQMAGDGHSWFYHNEHTGESVTRHPALLSTVDAENIIAVDQDTQRDSFQSDQLNVDDYKTAAATSKEVYLAKDNVYLFLILYSLWKTGWKERHRKVDLISVT
jgi:hypothetical protein